MEIRFFTHEIENFIEDLEKPTIAKTLRTLDLLEKFENKLGMPHSKKLTTIFLNYEYTEKQKSELFFCMLSLRRH